MVACIHTDHMHTQNSEIMYAKFSLDAQQVQIEVSPVSGLNKPESYQLHLQHTASLSH